MPQALSIHIICRGIERRKIFEDRYLKELVGYVHLNPLRARIVSGLKVLSNYPYCGHSAILGKRSRDFQDVGYVAAIRE